MCPLCRIIIVISKVNHNHTHLQRIMSVFMMCFRDRLIESVSRKFAVSCIFVLFLYYFHNFFNGSLLWSFMTTTSVVVIILFLPEIWASDLSMHAPKFWLLHELQLSFSCSVTFLCPAVLLLSLVRKLIRSQNRSSVFLTSMASFSNSLCMVFYFSLKHRPPEFSPGGGI